MAKAKKNELQKVCDKIIKQRKRSWDSDWDCSKQFLDVNEYLETVKEMVGDKKARFYFIDEDQASVCSIYHNLVEATINIWKQNINKRIKEITVADTYFVSCDGDCNGQVVMVR